jgi:hypothetical protein
MLQQNSGINPEDHYASVAFFKQKVSTMPEVEVKNLLITMYRNMMELDNHYKKIISVQWGMVDE